MMQLALVWFIGNVKSGWHSFIQLFVFQMTAFAQSFYASLQYCLNQQSDLTIVHVTVLLYCVCCCLILITVGEFLWEVTGEKQLDFRILRRWKNPVSALVWSGLYPDFWSRLLAISVWFFFYFACLIFWTSHYSVFSRKITFWE